MSASAIPCYTYLLTAAAPVHRPQIKRAPPASAPPESASPEPSFNQFNQFNQFKGNKEVVVIPVRCSLPPHAAKPLRKLPKASSRAVLALAHVGAFDVGGG